MAFTENAVYSIGQAQGMVAINRQTFQGLHMMEDDQWLSNAAFSVKWGFHGKSYTFNNLVGRVTSRADL